MGGEGPVVLDYLGHSVHALVVLTGIVGVVLVLAPSRHQAQRLGAHDLRIAVLRERVAAGGLATVDPLPTVVLHDPEVSRAARPYDAATGLLVAAVAGAAAAGVHAAVAPAHLAEGLVVSLFFLVSALAQSVWSCALLWRPRRSLIRCGIALNGGIVLVWVVSRTSGIPFVAEGRPEPVGVLDLAATGWELVVITCCARFLSRPVLPLAPPAWHHWPYAARCWAAVSVGLLGALTFLELHT